MEFQDPQAALSAIRNMNDYELNGRRLRVNFSNSSHLEQMANNLGMDLSHAKQNTNSKSQKATSSLDNSGTTAVADALKSFSKAEMYDVVAKLKEIADRDADDARRLIASHPQLPEALLFLMSKLDMIKTPLPTQIPSVAPPSVAPTPVAMPPKAPPPPRADPRAAARVDPRAAARIDPRQRNDPRARMQQQSGDVPPPMQPQIQPPPPPAYTPPPQASVANLDPALVHQVMSLTPQQISGLPPDKQRNILMLRQQLTGSR